MRKSACLLLLVCGAVALPAAETWRWRDANGVIHFSDVPVPGAERVVLGPAPKPGSVATPAPARAASAASRDGQVVPYARCEIVAPVHDQVFLNENDVAVSVAVEPGLQGGHQLRIVFNGQPVADWDGSSTSGTLTGLYRGTHTLVARVVDEAGRAQCTSPQVSFHVRLPIARPQPQAR